MKKLILIAAITLVGTTSFGQTKPLTITKLFPCYDRVNPKMVKTMDSLKKIGYIASPATVHRVHGTSTISITFVKRVK